MTHDRIGEIEKAIRDRSQSRDAEITELREAVAVAISKQVEIENRIAEVAIVVNQLRDIKPPGAVAFWGPGIALAAILGSAFTFVLNERVTPIKELGLTTRDDTKTLSDKLSDVKQTIAADDVIIERNTMWLRSLEPRVGMIERRLERLDERSKD